MPATFLTLLPAAPTATESATTFPLTANNFFNSVYIMVGNVNLTIRGTAATALTVLPVPPQGLDATFAADADTFLASLPGMRTGVNAIITALSLSCSAVTALPTIPSRGGDPINFASRAAALVAALTTFRTELNAFITALIAYDPLAGGPFTTTGLYGLPDSQGSTDYVAGAEFDSRQITASPTGNATCTGIAVFFGSTVVNGGKIKPAIYADNGSNAPGSLLASGNEYTIATADALTTKNLLFTSSATLTAGTKYWVVWITDTASHFRAASTSGIATTKWASYTYASGVPGTAPSVPNSSPAIVSKLIVSVAQGVAGYWDQETVGDYNLAANEIDLIPITTPAGGTSHANAVVFRLGTSVVVGGKMKAVIYSDSAGAPATRLGIGSEVTVASANTELSSTFSGVTLSGGTTYWIGCISDNASTLVSGPSSRGSTKWLGSLTYASGPPSSLSGMSSSSSTAGFYLKFS